MRQTTKVWAKFESMGKPNETVVVNDSVYQCVMKFADWLQNTYMGSYMRFTIARTQPELEDATRKWARKEPDSGEPDSDMMHDLMTLLGQKELNLEPPESAGTQVPNDARVELDESGEQRVVSQAAANGLPKGFVPERLK